MITVFTRIIQYGIKNFWRNGWLSAATVAVMIMALMVLSSLMMFSFITHQAVSSIQDKIDISVYFKLDTPEDTILSIKQSLESLSQVKDVNYVSTDEALNRFRESHKDDPAIQQALTELSVNPLQASLNVKAKDPEQYEEIAKYLTDTPAINKYTDSVSYYKNQDVINRLNTIVRNVNRGGVTLTVILAIIAGLMIFNTIWIATFSNREEITIMRVVGASNLLVRGPYIIEGVLAGLIAAVSAMILAGPFSYYVSPYIDSLIPGTNVLQYYFTNFFSIFWDLLLFGVGIGAASSYVAVRRYLKN
jgi:cell division transport system permease protein